VSGRVAPTAVVCGYALRVLRARRAALRAGAARVARVAVPALAEPVARPLAQQPFCLSRGSLAISLLWARPRVSLSLGVSSLLPDQRDSRVSLSGRVPVFSLLTSLARPCAKVLCYSPEISVHSPPAPFAFPRHRARACASAQCPVLLMWLRKAPRRLQTVASRAAGAAMAATGAEAIAIGPPLASGGTEGFAASASDGNAAAGRVRCSIRGVVCVVYLCRQHRSVSVAVVVP